ncbi:prophage endopeptidase tail family protein [Clostridioides difficile CD160]|nr:prophage endopeptidase tail family protein [Clostridioides difficile CD160]
MILILREKINLKEIKKDYNITLHKVNKNIIGQIPRYCLNSLTRKIDGIDELEFTISKYVFDRDTLKRKINIIYDMTKNERFICINNKEYFVIKEIKEDNYKSKVVKAYSREIKLSKVDINIENINIQLFTAEEENEIFSLNDYMKNETGWQLGHVDEDIAYDVLEGGSKQEKIRWQESVSTNWYDFITKNIKEEFNCVIEFDTFNKLVNLYNIDSFGDEVKITLTEDNYIKSIEKTLNTNDIVTRLKLEGNEEMDIIDATETGYPYIENYSYFIENGEMSSELMEAINVYEEMVKKRKVQWRELADLKSSKSNELTDKKNELQLVYAFITGLQGEKRAYEASKDDINLARIIAEITKKNDEKVILEVAVRNLEEEIENLRKSIDNVNLLCKRETATDEDGKLIFNDELLEELKEFVYYDTYTNSAFIKVEDLIKAGERILELKCKPTSEWSIDIINFLERILDNGRQHWDGILGLGDVIELYSYKESIKKLIYFVGYSQKFNPSSLTIELSNKKLKNDDIKTISDYLKMAKESLQVLESKKYLLIQQKYNKIRKNRNI